MKQNALAEALAQLDPANDEHWTSGGLPKVEVVKALLGEDVTRADIEAEFHGFDRNAASEDFAGEDEDEAGPDDEDDGDDEVEMPAPAAAPDDLKTRFETEIAQRRAAIDDLTAKRDKLGRDLRTTEDELRYIETRYLALFPPLHPSEAVKIYHDSALKLRQQTAHRFAEVAASFGMSPNSLVGTSKLDRAMAPNRRTGSARPSAFLLGKDQG